MRRFLLLSFALLAMTVVFGQPGVSDSVSIKYYLTPARNFQQDVMPSFAAYLKVNGRKYYLQRVMSNTQKGDVAPDIVYNKKAKRNEYHLKTWYAGGGTDFKAYVSGSKDTKTASVLVYAMDLDEQVPISKQKWRLIKAVKL